MNDQSILARIHPDFGPLLEAMAGAPALHTLSVPEAREAFRQMLPTAPQVAVGSVTDGRLPGPAGPLPIRVYAAPGDDPHPGILHFHGGGFVIGDLDTHDAQCRYLCRHAGATVIAVDYRMGPESPLPAAHEDCMAALRHVYANPGDFGVDPARLAVTGDSAGGNLSAVSAIAARDEGLPLKAQMPVVPAVDRSADNPQRRAIWAKRDNPILSLETVDFFMSHAVQDEGVKQETRLAPLLADDLSGLAPALIVTAEVDILHDEGVEYFEKIRAAGGHAEHIEGVGMIHPFFSMAHMIPAAEKVVVQAATRLGEMLRA